MKVTASDKQALIRLAQSLPVGDADRRAILAGLEEKAFRAASVSKTAAVELHLTLTSVGNRGHWPVSVMGLFYGGPVPIEVLNANISKVRAEQQRLEQFLLSKGRKAKSLPLLYQGMNGLLIYAQVEVAGESYQDMYKSGFMREVEAGLGYDTQGKKKGSLNKTAID